MKLRTTTNALRLRLKQSEVTEFAERGFVEDHVTFGPDAVLRYRLERSDSADRLAATFADGTVRVSVPAAQADRWVDTAQVGLEDHPPAGEGQTLHVLIEKDFNCLHRDGNPADDHDTFPHPAQASPTP